MLNKSQLSFAEGWTVFYQARTVFVVLVIIAMVINLAIFGTAKFAKKLILFPTAASMPFCPIPGMMKPATSQQAVPNQPSAMPDTAANDRSEKWKTVFTGLMNFSAILAMVSVILLIFCALIGVMMIIAGQLPGAGLVAGAFFWSAGMVALLLPWSILLPETSCLPIGVVSFSDLYRSIWQLRVCTTSWWAEISLWLRFAVYPIIILLMSVMYYWRTSQANTQILSEQTLGSGQ